MLDLDELVKQYLENIEPENNKLFEYFKAYQSVVDKFGFDPIIQPGQIRLLGWDLEYQCGAAFANFIDQILVRRLNDFIPVNDRPLILDCGANIGMSSLSYKRQFPNARIIAFEPDPDFVPLLRRNLERNGAGDVEVADAAVWIKNGSAKWRCEGIDGSHLAGEAGDAEGTVTVRTVDLGEYLNQPVDLIKMDIEGAEYQVVNHLGRKLNKVRAMSIECHLNQATILPFGEMLRVLKNSGFQLSINSFGVWRDLIRQAPVFGEHHENYLLVSAWRGSIAATSPDVSWIPNAGLAPIMGFVIQVQNVLDKTSEREAELLAYLKSYATSGEKALKRMVLKKPYDQEMGKSWTSPLVDLKPIADNDEFPSRSSLLLFEDDVLLRPAHALHDDIRSLGAGRYSHWEEMLYFSTSDGSDPNTNGREYRIIYST